MTGSIYFFSSPVSKTFCISQFLPSCITSIIIHCIQTSKSQLEHKGITENKLHITWKFLFYKHVLRLKEMYHELFNIFGFLLQGQSNPSTLCGTNREKGTLSVIGRICYKMQNEYSPLRTIHTICVIFYNQKHIFKRKSTDLIHCF